MLLNDDLVTGRSVCEETAPDTRGVSEFITAEAVEPVLIPTKDGAVLATMISPIAYSCPASKTYEAG